MINERLFFIQQHLTDKFSHGGVGFKDAEKVLISLNFQPLIFPQANSYSLYAKVVRLFYLLKCLISLPRNAVLVFIHPLHAQLSKLLVESISKYRKSVTLLCFIGDIEGFRDGDLNVLNKEKSFWLHCNKFLVHNSSMYRWLYNNNSNSVMVKCEFFDYLAAPFQETREKKSLVTFAGNFDKAQFIWQLPKISGSTIFLLYGNGKFEQFLGQGNVLYKGLYNPEILPALIEGSFGLIWDGTSIENLEGSYGEYNKYNSPHKLSLYILSSLPIICHKESAAAELVIKYNIGFTITSLHEVSDMIEKLTNSEYFQFQANCKKIAGKISSGGCIKKALQDLDIV